MINYSQNEINSIYLEKNIKLNCFNSIDGKSYIKGYQNPDEIINNYDELVILNEMYPTAYWGAVMGGTINGKKLWGFDVDCKRGAKGYEWLEHYERTYKKLPTTWEVLTPSGGIHKYFVSDNLPENARMGAYDVMTKGVLFIPSTKRNGGEYKFLNDPKTTPIAEAPLSLLHLLSQEYNIKKRNTNVKEYVEHSDLKCNIPYEIRLKMAYNHFDKLSGSRQGENASGYFFALAMNLIWGYCLTKEDAEDILYQLGQREDNLDNKGYPYKWTNYEIRHKINSAIKNSYTGVVGDKLKGWEHWVEIPTRASTTASEPPKIEKGKDAQDNIFDGIKFHTEDDMQNLPPIKMIVGNHFQEKSLSAIYGPSGHYKTFYALEIGKCLASGRPFLNKWDVGEKKEVLYIASEGFYGLTKRLQSWNEYRKVPKEERGNIQFINNVFNFMELNEAKKVKDACLKRFNGKLPVIFIDTMTKNFGGEDTKDNSCVQKWCDNILKVFCDETEVLVITHTGWNFEHERGASNIRDNVHTSIRVAHMNGDPYHSAECLKQKDVEQFEKYYIKPHFVGESIVLVATDASEQKKKDIDLLISMIRCKGKPQTIKEIISVDWVSEKWKSERTLKQKLDDAVKFFGLKMTGEGKNGSPYVWF